MIYNIIEVLGIQLFKSLYTLFSFISIKLINSVECIYMHPSLVSTVYILIVL